MVLDMDGSSTTGDIGPTSSDSNIIRSRTERLRNHMERGERSRKCMCEIRCAPGTQVTRVMNDKVWRNQLL